MPIAKVVFTGDFLVLDALSFDDAKPNIINGTKRNDKLGSAAGKDTSDGADVIIAKDGNDRIFARDGDDTVYGGKGNDKIHAGAGNDTLVGDQGKDKLWGEAGQDSFLFKGSKGSGSTRSGTSTSRKTISSSTMPALTCSTGATCRMASSTTAASRSIPMSASSTTAAAANSPMTSMGAERRLRCYSRSSRRAGAHRRQLLRGLSLRPHESGSARSRCAGAG